MQNARDSEDSSVDINHHNLKSEYNQKLSNITSEVLKYVFQIRLFGPGAVSSECHCYCYCSVHSNRPPQSTFTKPNLRLIWKCTRACHE